MKHREIIQKIIIDKMTVITMSLCWYYPEYAFLQYHEQSTYKHTLVIVNQTGIMLRNRNSATKS